MQFRILGPIQAVDDESNDILHGSKQRTVLAAMLLARGRVVSDEHLADRLWGDRPPATASAQIYTYISRLRKSFSKTLTICRLSIGYQMSINDLDVDLFKFNQLATAGVSALAEEKYTDAATQLRRALSLWLGDALGGSTEQLVDAERPQLEEHHISTLESRIEADLALGRHRQVTVELTGLVGLYPLRERLRAQLMTALVRSDRQADATTTFHQGRRLLRDEFGVEPGSTLTEVHQNMLTGVLDMPRVRGNSQIAITPTMLPRKLPDFVGRQMEQATIASAIATRRNSPIVIAGPLGIGKTALAVSAAHDHLEQFPDGQLYANMYTRSGRHIPINVIIGRFLRALGITGDELPTGLPARVQLYRSLLATRHVLVLADDVEIPGHLEILSPPGRLSAAIITTQNQATIPPGSRVIAPDLLDRVETMKLLTKIVGEHRMLTDPQTIAKVVEVCGGLPLALRILGSRLVCGRQSSVVDLADRLSL